jgi:hypothetical protein
LNRKWKVVILILGIAIVTFLIWWFNPYHGFPSAYTEVVVPLNNIGDYVHDGTDIWTRYVFTWGYSYLHLQNANITDVFYVDSVSVVKASSTYTNLNTKSYPTSRNSVYQMGSKSSAYGGIEFEVSEIHSDYIVLLVKPL